jgi:hypothetical protein
MLNFREISKSNMKPLLVLLVFLLGFYQVMGKKTPTNDVKLKLMREIDFRNAVESFCKDNTKNFCSEENLALMYKIHREQADKIAKEIEEKRKEREKLTEIDRMFRKNNQYRFLGDFSTFPFDFFV